MTDVRFQFSAMPPAYNYILILDEKFSDLEDLCVEEVVLPAKVDSLTHISFLTKLKPLRLTNLVQQSKIDFSRLSCFPDLESLELVCESRYLPRKTSIIKDFACPTKFTTLLHSLNGLVIIADGLSKLKASVHLNIDFSYFSNQAFISCFGELKQLEKLKFGSNEVRLPSLALSKLKKLKHLELDCRMTMSLGRP